MRLLPSKLSDEISAPVVADRGGPGFLLTGLDKKKCVLFKVDKGMAVCFRVLDYPHQALAQSTVFVSERP